MSNCKECERRMRAFLDVKRGVVCDCRTCAKQRTRFPLATIERDRHGWWIRVVDLDAGTTFAVGPLATEPKRMDLPDAETMAVLDKAIGDEPS